MDGVTVVDLDRGVCMGLFSKLFKNEGPDRAQGENASAPQAAGRERNDEKAVASRAEPSAPRARSASAQAEPAPTPAASDKQSSDQPRESAAVAPQPAPKETTATRPAAVEEASPPVEPPTIPLKVPAGAQPADATLTSAAAAPPKRAPLLVDRSATKAAAKPNPATAANAAPAKAAKAPSATAKATSGAQNKPPPLRKSAPYGPSTVETPPPVKRSSNATLPMFAAPVVPGASDAGASPSLESAVDAAVDKLLDASASPTGSAAAVDEAADRRAVVETFAAMAKLHAQPLREFMFQLAVGRTPRQWAAACRPVLRPLLQGSQQIGMTELADSLAALDAALDRAAAEPQASIGEAAASALAEAYARLHAHMPDAFAAAPAADSRRLVLIESLLLQVPSVHRRTLAKLYAAGLTSLAQLGQAKPDELSAVAGIERDLAQAIVEHVQRFERERGHIASSALRSHLEERLRTVVGRLEQAQAEFERAEQDESNVRKRAARRAREAAVLQLDLLFAEIGDMVLIEELKRFPVRGKIRRVESYLERLQASA